MTTLIIYFPPVDGSPAVNYEYALTEDGRALSDHASAPLPLLPPAQRGTEIVAVVPVGELSWHTVELPRGINAGSPRLRAILENLLEDRLLDDPAQLHLALGPNVSSSGGRVWVAACGKAWLRTHLQALEAAGRRVARIVPEFEPEAEAGTLRVHLTGEPDRAQMVATGGGIAGVVHVPFNAAALSLLPLPETGQTVMVAAEPAVAALAEEMLQGKVTLLTRAERWLDASRSPWDLAQFDLSSSGRARTVKRLSGAGRTLLQAPSLRPARWGVAALVAANLLGLNAWAWKEQSALKAKRDTVRSTLTQAFPQVRVVVDAPVQMERELAALRQATGAVSGRDLESMLAALSSATPPDKSLSAIEYSAGQARLKGLQLAEQDASALSGLKALGYSTQKEADTLVMRPQTTSEVSP